MLQFFIIKLIYFLKIKKNIKNNVFYVCPHLPVLEFFLKIQVATYDNCSSAWRTIFTIFYSASLLATNDLSLHYLRMFHVSLFLRINFFGNRFC